MALQRIPHQLAHRQRQVAVGATVLERDRSAVLQPVEDDRLAQDDAAEGAPADLVIVGGDVPVISQEHGRFPLVLRRALAASHVRSGLAFPPILFAAAVVFKRDDVHPGR